MATKCVLNKSTLTGIANAIRAKGGTTETMLPGEMAAKIASIPSGGEKYDWSKRLQELGWPDIESIVESDTHQYAGKQIELITDAMDTTVLKGGVAYLTSDGDFIQSTSNYTKTWDRSKDIAVSDPKFKVRWILSFSNTNTFNDACINASNDSGSVLSNQLLWYANSSTTVRNTETAGWRGFTGCFYLVRINARINVKGSYQINSCTSLETICGELTFSVADFSRMFQNSAKLLEIQSDISFAVSPTNTSQSFNNCYSLRSISEGLLTPNTANAQGMFSLCYALESLPDGFTVPAATTTAQMFNNCYSLKELPSGFSAERSTNTSSMFNNCFCLRRLSENFDTPLSTNTSSMFMSCYCLEYIPSEFSVPLTTNVTSMFQSCKASSTLSFNWSNLTSVAAFRDSMIRISEFIATGVTGAFSLGYNAPFWPEILDAPNATSMSSDNPSKSDILPRYANISCSWSIPCGYLTQKYKSNFAKFDSDGNLEADCMVSSLPSVSGKTLTLTNAATFKSWFTDSEKTTIQQALSAKGWTFAW